MKYELKINADGRQWDVVQGATIVSTHATIKLANDAKFELQSRKPRTVIAFRQDGSEITKRIRRVA
jgi:hypothetical protein